VGKERCIGLRAVLNVVAARIKTVDIRSPKKGLFLATRRHFRVSCQPEVEATGSALRSASDYKVGIQGGHGAKVTFCGAQQKNQVRNSCNVSTKKSIFRV
jgi:hypothetical protein